MSRPLAIDLFCGAGGAAMGLYRAGFDVIGVDHIPQPRYPFPFVLGDALEQADMLAFADFVWASPPCQAFSKTRAIHGKTYPNLIPQTRAMLAGLSVQTAIENVPSAPLNDPVMLCGTMFGLRVIRHRCFEINFPIMTPECGRHGATNSHRGYSTGAEFITVAGNNYRRIEGAIAMGIDWMQTRAELSEAIPPAYSRFIGAAALQHINAERSA